MPRYVTAIAAILATAATPLTAASYLRSDTYAAEVVGTGRLVTQRRSIGTFTAVEIRIAADVTVRVGARPTLTISADDNVLPLIRSDIRRGDVLVLETTRGFRSRRTPRIAITVPRLSALALRGSGDASIEGVNGGDLALALSGSGDIRARGRSGALSLAISGTGDINASNLASSSAAVAISGSGDALVRTNGSLTGVTQGSGSVRYLGQPSSITVRTAGSGRVQRAR